MCSLRHIILHRKSMEHTNEIGSASSKGQLAISQSRHKLSGGTTITTFQNIIQYSINTNANIILPPHSLSKHRGGGGVFSIINIVSMACQSPAHSRSLTDSPNVAAELRLFTRPPQRSKMGDCWSQA